MRRGVAGFTLIELMIVITVIVIIATIAIPNLIAGRLVANEAAAIETLRSVSTAQAQFQRSGKADDDLDGYGEHGTLGELSGHVGVRNGPLKVPTDLSASMGLVSPAGEVAKSGYIYRIYLPDSAGHGVRDQPGGGVAPGSVDPELSEILWCCYAWPVRQGVSGRRTFFVNQNGEILFTESRDYDGTNCAAILPGIAYQSGDASSIQGLTAVGTVGNDGLHWRPAN